MLLVTQANIILQGIEHRALTHFPKLPLHTHTTHYERLSKFEIEPAPIAQKNPKDNCPIIHHRSNNLVDHPTGQPSATPTTTSTYIESSNPNIHPALTQHLHANQYSMACPNPHLSQRAKLVPRTPSQSSPTASTLANSRACEYPSGPKFWNCLSYSH